LASRDRIVGGSGVAVGGTGVPVGGTGVAVGGTGVAVGGTGVPVGGTGVAVGGIGVPVGGTSVEVGVAVGTPGGVAVGAATSPLTTTVTGSDCTISPSWSIVRQCNTYLPGPVAWKLSTAVKYSSPGAGLAARLAKTVFTHNSACATPACAKE
jgi:hypothetical protein